MKNSENTAIDDTLSTLEQAIENRKTRMSSETLNRPAAYVGGYSEQMLKVVTYGREFAQEYLNKAVKSAREEPWDFLAKTAMYSFALGFFLSLRRRKPPMGKKA